MNCDDRKDLLLLYAADALDASEREELRGHIDSGCPRCAGSLVEAEATLAHLPLTVDPVRPPKAVRDQLMSRVREDLRTLEASERVALHPRRRLGEAWLRPALAAALGAVVTYLAISLPLERQREFLEARVAGQEDEIRDLRRSVEGASERIRILTQPAIQIVSLAGTDSQPDARGRIYWDRAQGSWHFYAASMEPAGAGKTYQLWFITPDQEKISAGTFDVDASGEGSLDAAVPEGISVAVAAVTDEPEGGSRQPTGAIHLVATL